MGRMWKLREAAAASIRSTRFPNIRGLNSRITSSALATRPSFRWNAFSNGNLIRIQISLLVFVLAIWANPHNTECGSYFRNVVPFVGIDRLHVRLERSMTDV